MVREFRLLDGVVLLFLVAYSATTGSSIFQGDYFH